MSSTAAADQMRAEAARAAAEAFASNFSPDMWSTPMVPGQSIPTPKPGGTTTSPSDPRLAELFPAGLPPKGTLVRIPHKEALCLPVIREFSLVDIDTRSGIVTLRKD